MPIKTHPPTVAMFRMSFYFGDDIDVGPSVLLTALFGREINQINFKIKFSSNFPCVSTV